MEITEVHADVDGDVTFPRIDPDRLAGDRPGGSGRVRLGQLSTALTRDALRRSDAGGRGLLADPTIDPFAQQVGVPAMPGVLLDHVDQHFT